jgi:hypothetical protein
MDSILLHTNFQNRYIIIGLSIFEDHIVRYFNLVSHLLAFYLEARGSMYLA